MANSQAKIDANRRYDEKTYKTIAVRLRIDEDQDIIKALEKCKDNGIPYREYLRELFDKQ